MAECMTYPSDIITSIFLPYQTINEDTLLDIYYR